MTQQEKQRRRFLWQWIERGLFCPASQSDQRTWCACFVMSLADLWEVGHWPIGKSFPQATVRLPIPEFAIEYDLSNWIGNPKRASLRITYKGLEVTTHHIDHAFDDRINLYNPESVDARGLYQGKSGKDELFADICWVLDRFVFHPCAHVHLSLKMLPLPKPEDAYSEYLHDVRFGMGITNPFAALFQYRVNMVLRLTSEETKTAKKTERDRVAAITRNAILGDRGNQGVPAGVLFERMR